MSRTRRKTRPGNKDEWVDGFYDRMEQGLVHIPMKNIDVWDIKGKRSIKKQQSKAQRLENKNIVKQEMERI